MKYFIVALKCFIVVLFILFVLFVFFVVIPVSGLIFIIQIPQDLVFGWIKFLAEVLPNITIQPVMILSGIGAIFILTLGVHQFLVWFYKNYQTAPQDELPLHPWHIRWTLASVAIFMLMFLTSIAITGVIHQVTWFAHETWIEDKDHYITRANVTEGLALAATAKTAVAENAAKGAPFDAGWIPPNSTKNVAAVSIDKKNGEIIIFYTETVAPIGSNMLILSPRVGNEKGSPLSGTFTSSTPPSGSITWNCMSADQNTATHFGTKGTISGKFVPRNCRE